MRIMYLLFSFTVGGTEKLVKNICNEISSRGNDVFLYVVNDLFDESLLNQLDDKVNVFLQKRRPGSSEILKNMIRIEKFIRTNNIDVVHVNSFDGPELLLWTKVLHPGVKIFYTVHGMHQYSTLNYFRKVYRNIICNRLIAISNCVAQDMIKFGASKKKVLTIYNGVSFCNVESEEKPQNRDSRFTIGCVARFQPKVKGQDILVKAMDVIVNEMNEDVYCVFAGGISDACMTEYQSLLEYIKEKRLEKNIEFIGNVDNINDFLNSIDVCVIPSRSEGFGLALVEAMGQGLPCIASDIEGPKEIVDYLKLGELFNSGDIHNLAEKILLFMENYEERVKEANIGREKVRKLFGIETMCNILETEYRF